MQIWYQRRHGVGKKIEPGFPFLSHASFTASLLLALLGMLLLAFGSRRDRVHFQEISFASPQGFRVQSQIKHLGKYIPYENAWTYILKTHLFCTILIKISLICMPPNGF
jgi:putative exporter of polyketide antibiotics